MALTTYEELRDAIQAKFDDAASLTDAIVADHITMGEALINRQVRGREMETFADLTISSQETDLPTGYLAMRRLYLDKDPNKPLRYFPPMDFWNRYGSSVTASPEIYTIEGGKIVVAPVPSSSETGKILYYQKSDIASSVPTLFTNQPDMYLYAASIYSGDFLDDDRAVMKNAGFFKQIVADYKAADKKDRTSGAPLEMRNDVNPSFRQEIHRFNSA